MPLLFNKNKSYEVNPFKIQLTNISYTKNLTSSPNELLTGLNLIDGQYEDKKKQNYETFP